MKFLFIVVCSFLYLYLRLKRNIHMLQQNFYNENNRYLKWGIKKFSNIFNFSNLIFLILNFINLFLHKAVL